MYQLHIRLFTGSSGFVPKPFVYFFPSDLDEEELPKLSNRVSHQKVVSDHRRYLGTFTPRLRQAEIMPQQVFFLQGQAILIGTKK